MLNYQCCYCAKGIDTPHREGVRITLFAMSPEGSGQDLFSHIQCLADRFGPTLAPETPFDAEAFKSD